MAEMTTQETLTAYSEGLDSEGHMRTPVDDRTHEQLVDEFVEYWESNPNRSPLAGRMWHQVGTALQEAAERLSEILAGKG